MDHLGKETPGWQSRPAPNLGCVDLTKYRGQLYSLCILSFFLISGYRVFNPVIPTGLGRNRWAALFLGLSRTGGCGGGDSFQARK